jgi:uncharacterized protein (DUF433 family)
VNPHGEEAGGPAPPFVTIRQGTDQRACVVEGVEMSTVDELLRGLESLTPDDRRKVVEWMLANPGSAGFRGDLVSLWMIPLAASAAKGAPSARSTLSGIETDPRVCGGEARIVRTRIPVWVLEQMRRQGISEADILRSYPTLRAEDLVNAWNYVDAHRQELESQIQDNENA